MSTAEPNAAETGPQRPGMRFAYMYFMTSDEGAVRRTAPVHADYWNQLQLPGYAGGPFADRSGGLITFFAQDEQQARHMIDADPFMRAGLIKTQWLKQWDSRVC
jgi:uncharacterized protein YciI